MTGVMREQKLVNFGNSGMNNREVPPKWAVQKVLVVDDERQVCDIIADALVYIGHDVVTAGDGEEALEKVGTDTYTIVITDMDMPKMDGMELIRHLARDHASIDVIAITGHTMKYRYTDVVAAGAADFITKPFTLDELEAKLNRLIRERLLREELERLAIRDPLTGLYNRRFFQKVARTEAIRAVRYRHELYLFYIDIDLFKQFNDQNGHQAGDELLVRLADVLRASIREDVDTVFRFGGDEFTVLLPYLPTDQASMVAARIQKNYANERFDPTSLSIGIARYKTVNGNLDDDIADMVRRADMALYHAKTNLGRNSLYFDA